MEGPFTESYDFTDPAKGGNYHIRCPLVWTMTQYNIARQKLKDIEARETQAVTVKFTGNKGEVEVVDRRVSGWSGWSHGGYR